jgi:hypothetical protein
MPKARENPCKNKSKVFVEDQQTCEAMRAKCSEAMTRLPFFAFRGHSSIERNFQPPISEILLQAQHPW